MANRIADLNNILFRQLERLNNPELIGKELTTEITRAHAVSMIAKEITANGDLMLKGHIAVANGKLPEGKLPAMIEDKTDGE